MVDRKRSWGGHTETQSKRKNQQEVFLAEQTSSVKVKNKKRGGGASKAGTWQVLGTVVEDEQAEG